MYEEKEKQLTGPGVTNKLAESIGDAIAESIKLVNEIPGVRFAELEGASDNLEELSKIAKAAAEEIRKTLKYIHSLKSGNGKSST